MSSAYLQLLCSTDLLIPLSVDGFLKPNLDREFVFWVYSSAPSFVAVVSGIIIFGGSEFTLSSGLQESH